MQWRHVGNEPWVDRGPAGGGAGWDEEGEEEVAAVVAPPCGETSGNAAASSQPGSATRRSSSALSGPKRPGCAASSFASSSPATSAIHAHPADAIARASTKAGDAEVKRQRQQVKTEEAGDVANAQLPRVHGAERNRMLVTDGSM